MPKIKVLKELEIIKEGQIALFEHLGPAKATRFWTVYDTGFGDYVEVKKDIFSDDTVDTLYEKILKFKSKSGDS